MIYNFTENNPKIDKSAFIHPSSQIIGKVIIEKDVSVWPLASIRGDVSEIIIKKGANVQDCAVLHPNRDMPVIIGEGVTIGHSAIVHGSKIGRNTLIGMGSIVIDSEIGDYCLIGAGCVVTPNSKIESGSLVLGVPFKIVRKLKDSEIEALKRSEKEYIELMNKYKLEE